VKLGTGSRGTGCVAAFPRQRPSVPDLLHTRSVRCGMDPPPPLDGPPLHRAHAVAELRPLPMGTRLADLPALLADLPRLDDPHAFEADLETARAELAAQEPTDPWAS
jgi:hypothetical protein